MTSATDNNLNGSGPTPTSTVRPLLPGVYVPTPCFFLAGTENVDVTTITRHVVRLAKAGVAGVAAQGSNGEAVHLTREERNLVTSVTRSALDDNGFVNVPVIVGCGNQSTRGTVLYCRDAKDHGADYALVLPPSYYSSIFASETVLQFYTEVADASPIPIIIYNFPAVVGGNDLSSDDIIRLAAHPNIVGVKLTCGNTGKLNRVAAATRAPAAISGQQQNIGQPPFLVLAGSADFALQSLVVGGHGMLAGLANIAPKVCVRTVELYRAGRLQQVQAMQDILARGDWVAMQGGVIGTKAALEALLGYGGIARSPLPAPTPEQRQQWKDGFKELWLEEKALDIC